jgi:hypothetical protein
MFLVFCMEMSRKATICPALFPATFNRTDEFSRRAMAFLNAGHAEKRTKCDEKKTKYDEKKTKCDEREKVGQLE